MSSNRDITDNGDTLEGTSVGAADSDEQANLRSAPQSSNLIDTALARIGPHASTRDQLAVLHGLIRLKDRELAEVARVSVATIRRWRRVGLSERSDTYDDLRVVVERLLHERLIAPALIAGWLRSRNSGLAYERPLDAIREENFDAVMHVVECFIAGSTPVQAPGSGSMSPPNGKAFVAPGSRSDPRELLGNG